MSKGEDFRSIARQRKEKVARRIGVRGKEEGRGNQPRVSGSCRLSLSPSGRVPLCRLGLGGRHEVRIPCDPVQQRQQLAHRRDHRPLVGMSFGTFLAVVCSEFRVPQERGRCGHVERVAHVLAASPDLSLPFLGSALPLFWRDADEPVELGVGKLSDFWKSGENRDRRDVAHAADLHEPLAQRVHRPVPGDRLQAGLLGPGDEPVQVLDLLPEHGLHVRVDLGLEPADHGRAGVRQRLAELRLALQLDRVDVLLLKRAHTGLVREPRDERRVDRVALREASLRPRELADAQGVRVGDRDVELVHEGDELKLISSRGLDADRGLGLSRQLAQFPEPFGVVVDFHRRRTGAFLRRRNVDVELLLRDIHTNVH